MIKVLQAKVDDVLLANIFLFHKACGISNL